MAIFNNFLSTFQVAENIKEFFHKEGIHSTTIQPEFVDYHPASDSAGTMDEDCVLNCPKGPGAIPAPVCEASKCCQPASAAASNGNLKRQTSKSAQNTPTTSRRPTSFHEHEVVSVSGHSASSCSTSNLAEATPLTLASALAEVVTPTEAAENTSLAAETTPLAAAVTPPETPMHAVEDHHSSRTSATSWH